MPLRVDPEQAEARFAPERLLEAWALYRIGIAGALLWLINSQFAPPDILSANLYWLQAALLVSMLAGALLLAANRSRTLAVLPLVSLHLLCDLTMAAYATYATGGMDGGLASMFILPVALGAMFLPQRAAPVPAAIASLILLALEYRLHEPQFADADWGPAGILGGLLFLVSLLANHLAQRARMDEQIARLAATSLGQMRALAAEVVERMQPAVVVIDGSANIVLRNAASVQLLEHAHDRRPLREREPALCAAMDAFRAAPEQAAFSSVMLSSGREVWPQFVHLPGEPPLLLVVIDDPERVERQTRQARLAVLGQVTAGVAHDLRNPLAALSNAAQLLAESPELDHPRLLPVIQRQTHRLNRVVERIYDLARPLQARPERVDLQRYLADWLADRAPSAGSAQIELQIPADLPPLRVDPDHLAECLHNLVDNAEQHARPPPGEALRIRIDARTDDDQQLRITITDNGCNRLEAGSDSPFAAFSGQGRMGLGLTLCRELLNANDGQIRLCREPAAGAAPTLGGTCFALRLPAATTTATVTTVAAH